MTKELIELCEKYGLDWNTATYLTESIIVNIKPVWQREAVEEIKETIEFAKRIAVVMDDLKSSHVFFVIQQAYKDMERTTAQEILDKVIKQSSEILDKIGGER